MTVVVSTVVEPCAGQQSVTAPGGVAVGRDIVNSPVTIGVRPEAMPGIIEATQKPWIDLTEQQKKEIDTLRENIRVTQIQLVLCFRNNVAKEVTLPRRFCSARCGRPDRD